MCTTVIISPISPNDCDQRVCMSVCLSVCLFVCLPARISRTHRPHVKVSPTYCTCYRLAVAVARSILWRQCNTLCTSGFVDDVMFSHNGANVPESNTTRMFRPVRRVAAQEATSAVSDCIVFELAGHEGAQRADCTKNARWTDDE